VRPDVHLQPGCPWYELSELRLPNVDWCEAQRCALAVEPANAFSNLGYVAIGLALIWLARRERSAALRAFGPAAIVVGLCSGVYHASYTFALQVLDFFAMYVFCYLLLVVNLGRAGALGARSWLAVYAALVAGTTALTVAADFSGIPIQGIVFVLIVAIVASELWLRARAATPYAMGFFWAAMAALAAGGVASALDVTRTWCDPHSLVQGHAIWHVLSAACLGLTFLHYRGAGTVVNG
jgi:hypothetical protein